MEVVLTSHSAGQVGRRFVLSNNNLLLNHMFRSDYVIEHFLQLKTLKPSLNCKLCISIKKKEKWRIQASPLYSIATNPYFMEARLCFRLDMLPVPMLKIKLNLVNALFLVILSSFFKIF